MTSMSDVLCSSTIPIAQAAQPVEVAAPSSCVALLADWPLVPDKADGSFISMLKLDCHMLMQGTGLSVVMHRQPRSQRVASVAETCPIQACAACHASMQG